MQLRITYRSLSFASGLVLAGALAVAAFFLVGAFQPTSVEAQGAPTEYPICRFDCSRVTYDLYIINPNGSERHMGTKYVKSFGTPQGTMIYEFEDSFIDPDFKDVRFEFDTRDCNLPRITLLSVRANWHHKVHLDTFYDGNLLSSERLWNDSHEAVGQSKLVDLTVHEQFPELCEADNSCEFLCDRGGLFLQIVNPDGNVRRTGDQFTKIDRLGPREFRLHFEDSGSDDDFNDAVFYLNVFDCQNMIVRLEDAQADWTHKIRGELVYDGIPRALITLWNSSLDSIGKERIININDFFQLCAE